MVLPPHILVSEILPHHVPVLCRVHDEGRHNLMSIVVDGTYPPVGVDSAFDLAMPYHQCRAASACYALFRGERKQFYHDIELRKGDFLELFSWEIEDDQTTCGDSSLGTIPSEETWEHLSLEMSSQRGDEFSGRGEILGQHSCDCS